MTARSGKALPILEGLWVIKDRLFVAVQFLDVESDIIQALQGEEYLFPGQRSLGNNNMRLEMGLQRDLNRDECFRVAYLGSIC
jgi:hypothetical protein